MAVFLSRLEELKMSHVSHVASGGASDYSEYKKICGVVEGIAIAEREFKELIGTIDDDDNA
tara:strand:- start:65 stop:247 length:183 start_codon:yes stop_codon:yes gene_type:complete